jgi:hypothetical protein
VPEKNSSKDFPFTTITPVPSISETELFNSTNWIKVNI